jgi:benzoyl-CoA reductase/2-hydroxyglutaryl-CoA dehydratase subunit BcrC/BadD/HgdB
VADVWRHRFPEDKIFRLTYPVARFDEDSVHFLAEELRILSESMKKTLGHPLSNDSLMAAVSLVDEFRNAAQTIYSCRVLDPNLVSYSEVTCMLRDFLTTPSLNTVRQISESAAAVSQILDAKGQLNVAKSLQNGLLSGRLGDIEITGKSNTPRVVVVGGMVEPQAIASVLKTSTRYRDDIVVLDLLSFGFKTVFTPPVRLEDDPFVAMARSILGAPSEPTQEGLRERLEFLKLLLSRLSVSGLLICEQSFCEPDQFEAPSLVNAASEVGVPSVRLPMDPELSDRARLEGRIQSFLETVEGGSK